MRLDSYLAQTYPELSRSTWQKRITRGDVQVNGVVEVSPKRFVDNSARVEVSETTKPKSASFNVPVIYEDEEVIVFDKPIGMLTHAKGELNQEQTIADLVQPMTTYHADTNRPGIVHRLDRDTSGVIICAKTEEAAKLLSKQFQDRRAKKTYIALLDGIPKHREANIDLPIARNPKQPSTFRVDSTGKSAQTHYAIEDATDTIARVRLRPTTGRTHQLRVHMAYINTPIRGDRIYGKAADRLYLHAHALEVTIPGGIRKTFTSQVPASFMEINL